MGVTAQRLSVLPQPTARIIGPHRRYGVISIGLLCASECSGTTKRVQRLGFQCASIPGCDIRLEPDGAAHKIRAHLYSDFSTSLVLMAAQKQQQKTPNMACHSSIAYIYRSKTQRLCCHIYLERTVTGPSWYKGW